MSNYLEAINQSSRFNSRHYVDKNNNPAGGNSFGTGFSIGWQHGSMGRGDARQPQTGAMVEDVIEAVIDRLRFYQSGKYACDENAEQIEHLQAALDAGNARTKERESRGVEGLNKA